MNKPMQSTENTPDQPASHEASSIESAVLKELPDQPVDNVTSEPTSALESGAQFSETNASETAKQETQQPAPPSKMTERDIQEALQTEAPNRPHQTMVLGLDEADKTEQVLVTGDQFVEESQPTAPTYASNSQLTKPPKKKTTFRLLVVVGIIAIVSALIYSIYKFLFTTVT